MGKAIDYLGLARKSGGIETGEMNAKLVVKRGRAKALVVAADASPGARHRAEGYVFGTGTPLVEAPYTKEEISAVTGRPGCSMAAFTDLGLAAAFAGALRDEYGERYAALAADLGSKQQQARLRAGNKGKRRKNV